MRNIFGFFLVFAGVIFGVYAGLWWAFIGGIVDVINAIKAPEIEAMSIAIGLAKVFFAGLIGVVSGFVAIVPGMAILDGK